MNDRLPAAAAADESSAVTDGGDVTVFTVCSSWSTKVSESRRRWSNSLHDGLGSTGRAQWADYRLSLLLPVQ